MIKKRFAYISFQFILLGTIVLITSCHKTTNSFFVPLSSYLEEGIVNKYYVHYMFNNKHDLPITDIKYLSYQLHHHNKLSINEFDPAKTLLISDTFLLEDNGLSKINAQAFYKKDSYPANLYHPTQLSTETLSYSQEAYIQGFRYYESRSILRSNQQLNSRDTVVENLPGKVIYSLDTIRTIYQNDTTWAFYKKQEIYLKDRGLFYKKQWNKAQTIQHELMQQQTLTTFLEEKLNMEERVAYISPNDDFESCYHLDKIYDYYNDEGWGAQYKAGKKALENYIYTNFENINTYTESGYLTLRFVVNCKGKIGRFKVEQATLDFESKQFNQQTIDHFLSLMKKDSDWKPAKIKGTARDSYAYITLKIKDGKIIEIFP